MISSLTTSIKWLLRSRWSRFVIAVLFGAMAGYLVYSITRFTGRALFTITGAVGGAAAVLVFQMYSRAARLTEVKVFVPQLSELTFVVDVDSRQVSWKLFLETVTRISTQPLGEDEGVIREALSSLYGLFSTTRDILKASRPSAPAANARTVENLAVRMLNVELRPFLAKWHPRLLKFERSSADNPNAIWAEEAQCRAELRKLQERIHVYALGFAQLAGVRNVEVMLAPRDE